MSDIDETMDEGVENEPVVILNPIAKPLADSKLTKKLLKLVKKSSLKKNKLHRGLKNVQAKLRKAPEGICILAGDVTPIDVYCHLPIVCEDKEIPYCFVRSKRDISTALGAKRPCIVALITEDDEYKDLYSKCHKKLTKLSC